MFRSLIAAIYLISIPGPSVWAQAVRVGRVPSGVSAPSIGLPSVAPALGVSSLGAPSVSLALAPLSAPSAPLPPALTPGAVPALVPLAAPAALPSAEPAAVPAVAAPAATPATDAILGGVRLAAERLHAAVTALHEAAKSGAPATALADLRRALDGDFDGALAALGDGPGRAELKELKKDRSPNGAAVLAAARLRAARELLSVASPLKSDAARRNAALWTLAAARGPVAAPAPVAEVPAPAAPVEVVPAPAAAAEVVAAPVVAPAAVETPADKPEAPATAPKTAPRLWGYLGGTFGAQLASNALQVTMPLLFLKMTGSAAHAAFLVTIGSAFDAAGTLIGGKLVDRVGSKPVLLGTTIARGAAMAVLPVLALTAHLTVPFVAAAYLVECLARGIADTARSTLPSELSGRDEGLLKRILAKNQSFFEAGGVAGPFIAGALIAGLGGVASAAALWLAPVAFAATFAAYLAIPKGVPAEASAQAPAAAAPRKTVDGWMRWALLATALLTMYPLKGLLPAIFATQVLHDAPAAAWLVGLFGVGGFVGSLIYGRWNKSVATKRWITAGGIGSLALAAAFLPGSFLPAALGVFAFAAANVAARLALNAAIQSRAAPGQAGASMGAARFTANLTGLAVRFLAGLAFTAALAPAASFWIVAGGVAVSGALLLAPLAAGRIEPVSHHGVARPSAAHGRPGRLIVVEGLDGSGKSTQMERLKEELEAKGLKVVTTSWNSSEVVSDAVKKAKKDQSLNAKTFALMNAADLSDRLEKTILPALDEGAIVLADRWFFTALARDSVRGNDARWLRRLYADAPRPDLVLYYRLPVKTAIGRVLSRSEGKLGLSEDFGDDEEAAQLAKERRGLKYYEAGLDAKLAADPIENFELFQSRVTASYDAQAKEYGFRVVDSSRGRDEIFADTSRLALETLGDLSSFKEKESTVVDSNLFDKDPSGDADNIRRNYMHEKRGAHFYFRNMLLPMQDRFARLMDMRAMPKVFLHGSPHVDNYAKNQQGAAMVDFDRARVGPYAWDLLRLMVSLSLRQKKETDGLLDADALKQLKKGYLRGFRHPEKPFSEVRELKDVEPEADEADTNSYLKADKKWAKEMRSNPLPTNHPDIVKLIAGYAKTQEAGFLNEYFVEEAGRGRGSMGFRGLFLVVLAPKDAKSGKDRILLNIKQVRTDPDTEWYKNPYPTEIERMHAAAELYAPGWALRPGSATLDGVEYDVRQVAPQNEKIKKMLNREQLMDFAYAVGTQLGRAHRLSLQDGATPQDLEGHLETHWGELVGAGRVIRDEIVDAHKRYLLKMKRDGLEPQGDGDDE